jgi:predicted RNA-binding Zn-ribbon protein involved in translation (DUF1610 family)
MTTRHPPPARSARIRCIECKAPVVRTVDDRFVCVDCGHSPIVAEDEAAAAGD